MLPYLLLQLLFFMFCMEENEGVEGLYQGDILLNEAQQTAVRSGTTKGFGDILWPGGVVPYIFSKEIGKMKKQY